MRLFLLTALTMAAFAANSVLNRMAVGDGLITAEQFALLRVLSGAILLCFLVRDRRLLQHPSVFGVIGLTAYLIGFSQAYIVLDAGLGALILFGVVQVTMFAGGLLQHETIPLRRWLGMVIAFAGLVFVLGGNFTGSGAQISVLFMSLAAIGWGVYSLAGQRTTDPLAATARNFLWSTPLVALTLVESNLPTQTSGILLAVISGGLTSGLGYALWYSVIPQLGASRAAVAQLTVPVIAIAGGAVILSEPLSVKLAIATVVVLGGVALSLKR